jgi:hypothetical protein
MNYRLIATVLLALPLLPSIAEGDSAHRVYPSGKPVLPKYIVRPSPNGTYKVYDAKQVVVPKYIVKPLADGKFKVYEAGRPVLPIKEVRP